MQGVHTLSLWFDFNVWKSCIYLIKLIEAIKVASSWWMQTASNQSNWSSMGEAYIQQKASCRWNVDGDDFKQLSSLMLTVIR